MRRRDALVIGAAVAVAVAIPPILRRIPSDFQFDPLPGFDGFRRLSGREVSGISNPFFDHEGRVTDQGTASRAPESPCLALFGARGWSANTLPVAVFSDFNCPNCKVQERRLFDLRDAGAPLRFIWHELPLLGPASLRAARAVLAARVLGVEDAARVYLSDRLLRPGPTAVRQMADNLGVSPLLLQRELEGERVSADLAASMGLATRLGIPGTPGTVIGRTLVIGSLGAADLKRLVQIERSEPQTVCP